MISQTSKVLIGIVLLITGVSFMVVPSVGYADLGKYMVIIGVVIECYVILPLVLADFMNYFEDR